MLEDTDVLFLPHKSEINVTSMLETVPENETDLNSGDDSNISHSIRARKRLKYLTESDSDCDHTNESINRKNFKKTKISSSESGSDCLLENDTAKHLQKYESSRTEDRRKKLRDKFTDLKSPKVNKSSLLPDSETNSQIINENDSQSSDEEISCLKIKKKVKKKKPTISSVCDPDTSDEDVAYNSEILKRKSRPTETASPKQMRMSAKEAIENMHKIKSESNRMLREKDVSLPYHKPKALSLQDIMSRKRPALTNDGKALPIKMNNEQLQQYVKLLEERQKEMIELCKSDTEDEEISEIELNKNQIKDIPEKEIDKEHNNIAITNANDSAQKQVEENNTSNIENSYSTGPRINDTANPLKISQSNLIGNILENHLNINSRNINGPNHIQIVTELPAANLSNNHSEIKGEGTLENHSYLHTDTMNKLNHIESVTELSADNSSINNNSEIDSQGILLHLESEKSDTLNDIKSNMHDNIVNNSYNVTGEEVSNVPESKTDGCDDFSDDEFNIENIDKIIEEAEIINDTLQNVANKFDSTIERTQINIKPILTGSPGMFIDLENENSLALKKNNGIELLKERFEYFAKLKSAEELEKNRETKYKPGTQHLKLKHDLEEQIAEQRSIEWEKRLEEEKLKAELKNELSDEDEIDKIEAKLEENESQMENNESDSSEEEIEENDIDMSDKPKIRNPMIDDEAEESEEEQDGVENRGESIVNDNGSDADLVDCSDNDESSEESSESEDEVQPKEKKGRILKAFEDSDDESSNIDKQISQLKSRKAEAIDNLVAPIIEKDGETPKTQDEELQLAQVNKSLSDDIFATQDSEVSKDVCGKNTGHTLLTSPDLGSQTFSILDSTTNNNKINLDLSSSDKISIPSETLKSINDDHLDLVTKMCGNFSQGLVDPECPQSQLPPSQQIGDDIAALCTGKFYDNPFVSQHDENNATEEVHSNHLLHNSSTENVDNVHSKKTSDNESVNKINTKETSNCLKGKKIDDGTILKSILDELDEPDFETQTQNKYFMSKESEGIQNTQLKKKFVIDSDDELCNESDELKPKTKKLKKRKAENRVLKISDDEDEESEKELEESDSEIEEEPETIVEYDSEENEIEVKIKSSRGKKIGEFFENEAEMTSEDEWVGSGDEDEAGLDRMEREAGDDDVFQQGALQRELGQIHMREVLDQDKREVRLLQELLFEDGDLGDGHRQRKFRWKTDADGDEEAGRGIDDITETQEEEFESEEQWRKQRHERELFLRQMQEKGKEEVVNTSINRTTIIKANLSSRSMSSLISETKSPGTEKEPSVAAEKKYKDIPSPKNPFTLFKQSYHGSLLTRGRGALARLAALATPLAADDDAPKLTASASSRHFVFAARAPADVEPTVTKRKADNNVSTPKLIKKMKTEETQKYLKNSLFDHFKS